MRATSRVLMYHYAAYIIHLCASQARPTDLLRFYRSCVRLRRPRRARLWAPTENQRRRHFDASSEQIQRLPYFPRAMPGLHLRRRRRRLPRRRLRPQRRRRSRRLDKATNIAYHLRSRPRKMNRTQITHPSQTRRPLRAAPISRARYTRDRDISRSVLGPLTPRTRCPNAAAFDTPSLLSCAHSLCETRTSHALTLNRPST